MSLYKRRERFGGLSERIGNAFAKLRLSPNHWTALSLVFVAIAFYFLATESFLFAGLSFFVSIFLDIVDGAVARATGKASKKGAYFDTVVDRYVEGIIVFGLLFAALPMFIYPAFVWIFLYFFGALMTTYAKSAAKEKGLVERELKGGLLERAERVLMLFGGIILAHFDPFYLTSVLVILAILTNVSAIERIGIALRKRE
jgi:phosphatidylglycerophosphate synthase